MVHFQSARFQSITPPAAISDNASPATTEIDTAGYSYMQIFVVLGAMDIAMTALKVTESDTAGSGHADVTGLVYGTSTDLAGSTSALPSATDDNKCFLFEIDLRGRKRYIDVTATTGDGAAGTFIAIHALLSRPSDLPVTATERNFGNILRV